MSSLVFNRFLFSTAPDVQLQALVECNSTRAQTKFSVATEKIGWFDLSMSYRYAVLREERPTCYTLIEMRETDLTSLIKPFDSTVWTLTLFSSVVIAGLISLLKRDDFLKIFVKIWMNFVTAVEPDTGMRRYSRIISAGSALVLCFFIGQAYNNFIMYFFLFSPPGGECNYLVNCHHVSICYVKDYLLSRFLYYCTCLCSIKHEQRLNIGKPLRKARDWEKSKARKLVDTSFMFFQKHRVPHHEEKGQLLLVSSKSSSTIDRLFAAGIVSDKSFALTRAEYENFLNQSGPTSFMRRYTVKVKRNSRMFEEQYVGFGTNVDMFVMESFKKLFPIFATCILLFVALFCCELGTRRLISQCAVHIKTFLKCRMRPHRWLPCFRSKRDAKQRKLRGE